VLTQKKSGMRHKKVITSREKLLIIEEYLSTSKSSRELEKKYNVSQSTIARWGREFKSTSTSETVKNKDTMPSEPKSEVEKDLEIKLLKKSLKDKEDKIKVLEMTISKASELFGVDIKKKVRYQVITELNAKKLVPVMKSAKLLGLSRQAYYQYIDREKTIHYQEEIIIQKVITHRMVHKKKGTRKVFLDMQSFLKENRFKIGRDAFFAILRNNNLLIRRRRSRIITTDSKHRFKKYPNLIKDMVVIKPNQLWVSDITYVICGSNFAYLSLVTDAYSRKIVGHYLSKDLKATGPLKALKRAISAARGADLSELTHHSDRGIQYCCDEYVRCLGKENIRISMTQSSDPLDNAIAERVNGIIKNEYELEEAKSFTELSAKTAEAVYNYNNLRQHNSIDNYTPAEAHRLQGSIKRLWKSYHADTYQNVP